MKCSRSVYLFAMATMFLAMNVDSASAVQYTTTCQSGQWDMLSLMFMQQSYLANNYYVYGTWLGLVAFYAIDFSGVPDPVMLGHDLWNVVVQHVTRRDGQPALAMFGFIAGHHENKWPE
jgi:hypothetical protein